MKILTQTPGDMQGYHGTVGTPTNMYDSFGERLYVGDVVLTVNQDEFAKQNRYLGEEYGLHYVCEENTRIANWTGKDQFYVMGIASVWNSIDFPDTESINFEDDYWDFLLSNMRGWIVKKMKSYEDVVEGEKYDFLYMQTVNS